MPWLLRMTLLVSGIMVVAHIYLGWRLTKSLSFLSEKYWVRRLPVFILLTFYCLPLFGLTLFYVQGHLDLLEIPKPITYWFWFGFAFSYQLLSWIVIIDVLKAGFHLWSSREAGYINIIYGRVILAAVAVIFVYSGVKMYLDTSKIQVETIELSVEGLPPGLQDFSIVHISDIQGDQYTGQEEIESYVEKVNRQNPDIVIFTGDLISYGTDFIEMSAEALSRVESTYGTYAVVGDHDYWAGLSNVEPALESRGIQLLKDENRFIDTGNSTLLLTGITQVYSKRADPDLVNELTAGADTTKAPVRILAAHQVSELLLNESVNNNYRLFLSGHTHGGQVRVPLFGMTFSASDMETEFVSGVFRRDNLLINVNNGLGFTLAPVRYNAPPSISVIKLRKQ